MTAGEIMTRNPKTISATASLTEAKRAFNQSKKNTLIVTDQDNIVSGVVQIYALEN